jgi:hypothetical protein
MSPLVILLIVVLLAILFYMIYVYFFSSRKSLASSAYLGAGMVTVQNQKIVKQQANTFNYSMWVYVNSWPASSGSSYNNLLSMVSGTTPYCALVLNKVSGSSPQLEVWYKSTNASPTTQKLSVTKHFPIQKWCYVVVNVSDSKTCDIYLDGKLVSSQQISYSPPQNQETDGSVQIILGDPSNPDIYLGNVLRDTSYASPEKVWKTYSSTSVPTSNTIIPSYNLQFSLYTDGELQTQKSLF